MPFQREGDRATDASAGMVRLTLVPIDDAT